MARARVQALELLGSRPVRDALELDREDPRLLEAYGRHQFGRSMLLARRVVEAGVRLVQVNVGSQATWDTHDHAFAHLKDHLLPPFDQALLALLDNLSGRGLLPDTLVVAAGEFGRKPRLSQGSATVPVGRDHWGPLQSALFAGGGVRGGRVVGTSDRQGPYPSSDPHTPADLGATVLATLSIEPRSEVRDAGGRPFILNDGRRIEKLFA